MAKKVTKAELKKMAKALNKLDLTDEPVDLDVDDIEELAEGFMDAMEEIDDDGKTDEVDKKIIKFYIRVMKEYDDDPGSGGGGEGDDLREELEDMELKEIKAYIKENKLEVKTKVIKKNLTKVIDEIIELSGSTGDGGDGGGDFDRDALEEELNELSYVKVKKYVKENDLDVDIPKKKDWDDEREDCIEEILDAMEEKAEEGGGSAGGDDFDRDAMEEKLDDMPFKDVKALVKEKGLDVDMPKKKEWEDEKDDTIEEILDALEEAAESGGGKSGKDKKDKPKGGKGKKDKLPKGMRKDSLPAKIYAGLQKKEMTVMDVAKLIGKDKKKDADKCINMAVRTIAKSVAKACSVNICYNKSNGLEDGVVSLADD